MCALPTESRSRLNFQCDIYYKLFCYHYTVNMHQTPCSLISCNGKIHQTVSLSQDIVDEQYRVCSFNTKQPALYSSARIINKTIVVPIKSDSDVKLCLQLPSKTLTRTLHLS